MSKRRVILIGTLGLTVRRWALRPNASYLGTEREGFASLRSSPAKLDFGPWRMT
jgi:hypothetical protein